MERNDRSGHERERRSPGVLAAAGFLAMCLAGCDSTAPHKQRIGYLEELGGAARLGRDRANPLTGVAFWDGGHFAGTPSIEINLRTQQARFFKGETLIGVSPISSGTEARRTPAGNYSILEKDVDHFSSSYGTVVNIATEEIVNDDATPKSHVPPGCRYEPAPMSYFMRLTWDGIGMHEGFLPGYPASHGCIRMDKEMVRHFYANAKKGTPVKVIR